jgi:hypothetical protein
MFETEIPRYMPSVALMGWFANKMIFGRLNMTTGEIERIEVGSSMIEAIKMFWDVRQDKVRAIKLVREVFPLGLKEAKDLVESVIGQR